MTMCFTPTLDRITFEMYVFCIRVMGRGIRSRVTVAKFETQTVKQVVTQVVAIYCNKAKVVAQLVKQVVKKVW